MRVNVRCGYEMGEVCGWVGKVCGGGAGYKLKKLVVDSDTNADDLR